MCSKPPRRIRSRVGRRKEEVKLADKSLDVPLSVEARELSRLYRQQIAKLAFNTGMDKPVRSELCRKLSWAIHHTVRERETEASREYCAEFELEERQVLVGLDRNPKSAAVMSEQTYRAGMLDTYAGDKDNYQVLTDPEAVKAAWRDAEKRIWKALPRWIPQRPMKVGLEHLNLKEK